MKRQREECDACPDQMTCLAVLVSVVVTHQASDDPTADFLEHDRDTVEAATVADAEPRLGPKSGQKMRRDVRFLGTPALP